MVSSTRGGGVKCAWGCQRQGGVNDKEGYNNNHNNHNHNNHNHNNNVIA